MIPRRIRNLLRALMSVLLAWRCSWPEQSGGNKIEHRGPALRDPLTRQRIETDDLLHHRGTAEIKNDHGDHRRHKVRGIDRTKFAVRDALAQQLAHANEDG